MTVFDRILNASSTSPVRNYALPGLTSWLVDFEKAGAKVRLFTADRYTEELITPHSHRFDFACYVIDGRVENTSYVRTAKGWEGSNSNRWAVGTLRPKAGGLGAYEVEHGVEPVHFTKGEGLFKANDWYSMNHDDIHSIRFSKGARVLFFEGPPVAETSVFLEPFCDGRVVHTFETRPWMFERVAA